MFLDNVEIIYFGKCKLKYMVYFQISLSKIIFFVLNGIVKVTRTLTFYFCQNYRTQINLHEKYFRKLLKHFITILNIINGFYE